jgi:5-amino-6-(5-phosphoribosylamino)uracil reductase
MGRETPDRTGSFPREIDAMPPLPYLIHKCALSLDGFIDDASSERLILSNTEDFDRVDAVRAECDAILVGAGTIRADNPRLLIRSEARRTARLARGLPAHPLKVAVTASGRIARELRFFDAGDGAEKLVYCADEAAEALSARVGDRATVVAAGQGRCDPRFLLEDLANRGVHKVLLEGGRTLGTLFHSADLVDELQISIAPFFVGDANAPRFVDPGSFPHNRSNRLILESAEKVGDMAVLTYRRSPNAIANPSARNDAAWLLEAIELSRSCVPSPSAFSVGAIIVNAAGKRLETGYSREGEPREHAEEAALRKASTRGVDVRGATIYSSLEPCSVRLSGRRSCTDLIVDSGIARVVFALSEPPTFVHCEGAARLRAQGLEVVILDALADAVRKINTHVIDAS